MKELHRNRILFWDQALSDAVERLGLAGQLDPSDARSGIIKDALRESAVLAVMRVFGRMGDKGPDMAANDDKFLDARRDILMAEIAERLGQSEEDIRDLLDRAKKTRNWFIGHTSGKMIEDLKVNLVRVGDSIAKATIYSSPCFLSDPDYAALLDFCDRGLDVLHDWLKEIIPDSRPEGDSL